MTLGVDFAFIETGDRKEAAGIFQQTSERSKW